MTPEEYRAKMFKIAAETIPKESKKFLVKEALKLKKQIQQYADSTVPVSKIAESDSHKKYHQSFKLGKTYKYNEAYAKRVLNNSGHSRYVEHGRTVARGYKKSEGYKNMKSGIKSKHYPVMKPIKAKFDPEYYADCDKWIEETIQKGLL